MSKNTSTLTVAAAVPAAAGCALSPFLACGAVARCDSALIGINGGRVVDRLAGGRRGRQSLNENRSEEKQMTIRHAPRTAPHTAAAAAAMAALSLLPPLLHLCVLTS